MMEQLQFREVACNLSSDRIIVDEGYLTRGTDATEASPW